MAYAPDWFARYPAVRRRVEVGFWVVVLALQAAFNSLVSWMERSDVPVLQTAFLEATSAIAIGLLIPAIAAFERRAPLRWDALRTALPLHLGASLVFCALHVLGMVVLRKAGYALAGSRYDFGDWPVQLAYEYLKDVRTYALIVVALMSYRFLMLRLGGEAKLLDAPEPAPGADAAHLPAPRPTRFLVRKLRREFLVAAADIGWLQAEGNYVGLHVNGHDYLLRSTFTEFLQQLDPERFVRVHRSHAVNLDHIAEITPLDSGDARLTLRDGATVPCSRRYRDAIGQRARVAAASPPR
ncbi:LytTR family DNA-binding domain-containing protein [Hydrogenophaga sp. 2FB]|uniref:LytTR family DNA-binding domain-containing protein n=1 Tax=Hydrogenophaga sp. 2FB TaxID=2502187 RepID=UPI0010F8C7BD|nr:LytTR family DNA-binding domain-containing protein [Hydrogenophaga sp. 2FB]